VRAGRLSGSDKIGLAVGKIINKYKAEKHFHLTITDDSLSYTRNQENINTEAAQDGIYVIRTSVPAGQLDPPGVVTAYKNLAYLEGDWRIIKADDLALRPIHHRLTDRVKAHVLICMLACYLVWHLRHAWAELTFTDEDPPERADPVAPATHSERATAKAASQITTDGDTARSFAGLLEHLAAP
jgi:transposase